MLIPTEEFKARETAEYQKAIVQAAKERIKLTHHVEHFKLPQSVRADRDPIPLV